MIKNRRTTFPVWNYVLLLTKLGPDRQIQGFIEAKGYRSPPNKTIAGWRQRNSIPGKWAPLLIEIALERKKLTDIDSLWIKAGGKNHRARGVYSKPPTVKPEWADL